MKWLIGITILTVNTLLAVNLQEQDKKKHVAVCTTISAVVAYKTHNVWYGIGAAMLVGIAKELSDNRFDNGDIKADSIGSIVGVQVEVLKW